MLEALQLCSLALNPSAPSPTATMVKVEDGKMISFGGTFCVSVPLPVEIGACFNPTTAATFFRKTRKGVSYKIHKGKLEFKEGKEKLSVPCLPPEDMVTLDVFSKTFQTSLDKTYLKLLIDVIDPSSSRLWAQGVSFRDGMAESTNSRVIISSVSGLPDQFVFNLPVDSAKALLKFKSPVVGIALDERAVKFCFEDGSSLASLLLEEQMIPTGKFYSGDWISLDLQDANDLLKIKCDSVNFLNGNVTYFEKESSGTIEGSVNSDVNVTVNKESFDRLLCVSSDIRLSQDATRLMAVGDTCRAICTTKVKHD